jgi:xanthine/uracil/vitamin C permease (AzgA family)
MDVPVAKALAGCMVAAGVVGLLAVVRVLSIILGIVPDSIKLAVVSAGCFFVWGVGGAPAHWPRVSSGCTGTRGHACAW